MIGIYREVDNLVNVCYSYKPEMYKIIEFAGDVGVAVGKSDTIVIDPICSEMYIVQVYNKPVCIYRERGDNYFSIMDGKKNVKKMPITNFIVNKKVLLIEVAGRGWAKVKEDLSGALPLNKMFSLNRGLGGYTDEHLLSNNQTSVRIKNLDGEPYILNLDTFDVIKEIESKGIGQKRIDRASEIAMNGIERFEYAEYEVYVNLDDKSFNYRCANTNNSWSILCKMPDTEDSAKFISKLMNKRVKREVVPKRNKVTNTIIKHRGGNSIVTEEHLVFENYSGEELKALHNIINLLEVNGSIEVLLPIYKMYQGIENTIDRLNTIYKDLNNGYAAIGNTGKFIKVYYYGKVLIVCVRRADGRITSVKIPLEKNIYSQEELEKLKQFYAEKVEGVAVIGVNKYEVFNTEEIKGSFEVPESLRGRGKIISGIDRSNVAYETTMPTNINIALGELVINTTVIIFEGLVYDKSRSKTQSKYVGECRMNTIKVYYAG